MAGIVADISPYLSREAAPIVRVASFDPKRSLAVCVGNVRWRGFSGSCNQPGIAECDGPPAAGSRES